MSLLLVFRALLTYLPAHSILGCERSDREELLERLTGQLVHIPDLRPVFASWEGVYEEKSNQAKAKLRPIVDARLERIYQSYGWKAIQTLKAADFTSFTALWWPEAEFERLQTLAFLVIWLFTWDDEVDEPTGFCSDDVALADEYRRETIAFVQQCLGLSKSNGRPIRPQNIVVESFRDIGEAFRSAYSVSQRETLYQQIVYFMQKSEQEQRLRLTGRVPSLAEYWNFRMGTSAVHISSAAGEFATQSCLPAEIVGSEEMEAVWHETNVIISITNDLLSLRKEAQKGCIDSLVPLTFAKNGHDMHAAVIAVVKSLETSVKRFESASQALLAVARGNGQYERWASEFVKVSRANCVGNFRWSMRTSRYGMADAVLQDFSSLFIFEHVQY